MTIFTRPFGGPTLVLLSTLAGALPALAFPRPAIWPLAFIGLVPLILAVQGRRSKSAFGWGFLAGLVHMTLLLYWIFNVLVYYGGIPWFLSGPIMFLLVGTMALFTAMFCLGLNLTEKIIKVDPGGPVWILAGATIWTGLEHLKSFFLTGFPWEPLGAAVCPVPLLVQPADLFGTGGLSFAVVLVNMSLAAMLLRAGRPIWAVLKPGLFILALLGLWLGYGQWRLSQIEGLTEGARFQTITIAQGSIEQEVKWERSQLIETLHIYQDLTIAGARENPWLLVWPETAAPFFFPNEENASRWLQELVASVGRPLLFGAPSYRRRNGGADYFNRAYLLDKNGEVAGHYDKVHLVPFGEYVPLKNLLFFVDKLTQATGDYIGGEPGRIIDLDGIKIGVLICYESIFAPLARDQVRNGADYLAVLTNDAWFGRSSAPYQHFDQSILRAVENRRSVIRAANTGVSGLIFPSGRVEKTLGLFQRGVLTVRAPVIEVRTVYAVVGDIGPAACLGGVTLLFGAAIVRTGLGRRKKRAGKKNSGTS